MGHIDNESGLIQVIYKGLVLNRWQAITWTNIDTGLPCYIASSWGSLNIKMLSHQDRDPHVKDKTVSVLSLTWESPNLGKKKFLYWDGAQVTKS